MIRWPAAELSAPSMSVRSGDRRRSSPSNGCKVLMTSATALVSRDACVARDATDPLRGLRDRFVIPDGVIYLDGNSLGPMPRAAASRLGRTIEQEWGEGLIKSWNTAGWF